MRSSTLRRSEAEVVVPPLQGDLFDTFANEGSGLISKGTSGRSRVPSASVFDIREYSPGSRTTSALTAKSARDAGRIAAGEVSEVERQKWLAERIPLVDKEIAGTLTTRERGRLAYVRWSLDRIEDARHGHVLDELEESISKYEHFVEHLQSLGSHIAETSKRQAGRKGPTR
jgi:hypothetical protein